MAAERYLSRRIPDLRVGNNIDEIDKKLIPASIHPWFLGPRSVQSCARFYWLLYSSGHHCETALMSRWIATREESEHYTCNSLFSATSLCPQSTVHLSSADNL